MELLFDQVFIAFCYGLFGAILFAAIGLISGTDETATIAPLTLLIILLGAPPVGVFTFWMAAVVAKHMTHAIPTALLGIPGDTLAAPLMAECEAMRKLGAPHIALRKMISGAIVSAFIAVPCAVLFASLLAPFGDAIKSFAPWIFAFAAILITYFSPGKLASTLLLIPFVVLIIALQSFTAIFETKLAISYFLGIAVGPLIADLFLVSSPLGRKKMRRESISRLTIAPEVKSWTGYFPNPFKVLDKEQIKWTAATSVISSATFVFSPVAMTVALGEVVSSRFKQVYQRLTTTLAAKNGVTESTYIAEALIPLIAFGLPLSPVAAGPAAPLFNAPPVFTVGENGAQGHNLHHLLSQWEFLGYGLLAVFIASIVSYPFAMNYARRAALFVTKYISHEAIIATFVGLILVISLWEGAFLGVLVIITVGLVGGLLSKHFGFNTGCQFMGYYMAILSVPKLIGLMG